MIKILKSTLLTIGIAICSFGQAQQTLTIENAAVKYDDQERPAASVLIEPGVDKVRDAWEDFIKDNYDIKLEGNGLFANKDVLKAEKVKMEALSDKYLNFYSEIIEEDENTRINVFATLGYDINVSEESYPETFEAMKELIRSFLKNYVPNYYQKQVEIVSEKLSDAKGVSVDLNDEMVDNKEDIKDYESKIESLRSENEKLTKQISDNESLIGNLEKELSGSKDDLESAKQQIKQIKQINE